MEFSDRELVGEARSGSAVAFERLMKRYERLVFKVAYCCAKDREHAMDITQNVFLKVHRQLPGLRGDDRFKGWLLRITYNESFNWIRSQRRHEQREDLPQEELVDRFECGQEEQLVSRERRRILAQSILSLNPRQRLAVTLRYFEGMPIREIASVLRCTEGVAKNILFRSLRKMRQEMTAKMEVARHEGMSTF